MAPPLPGRTLALLGNQQLAAGSEAAGPWQLAPAAAGKAVAAAAETAAAVVVVDIEVAAADADIAAVVVLERQLRDSSC